MKWLSSVTIAVLAVFANGPPRRVTAQVRYTTLCRVGTLDCVKLLQDSQALLVKEFGRVTGIVTRHDVLEFL
jgi:CBS domain containing-hemolysin-like protein